MRTAIVMLAVLCANQAVSRADPLPNPDPAIYGEDPPPPPAPPPRSHVPEYVAAAATSVFAVGSLFSIWRMYSLSDERRYDYLPGEHEYNNAPDRWKTATFVLGGAAVASGVLTFFLWTRHRAPAFDVNASGQGAVVTYAGRF